MKRSEARELVMQIFFQIDFNNDYENPDMAKYLKDQKVTGQKAYIDEMVKLLCENKAEIDEKINAVSNGWSIARMAKTDAAILRLATCEILYMEDVPKAIAANEAVNLAKKFCSDNSPKFVNGILAKIGE